MSELTDEVKRLKNLKQNKTKPDHLLEKAAQKNIWRKQVDLESRFDSADDKKLAEKLLDDYLDNYLFESFSDVNTLGDLVFEEVIKHNVQRNIQKKISKKDDENAFIPANLISSLHEVEERVNYYKEMLGINKKEETKDDLSALQKLLKRFKLYIPFARNEFEGVCPGCGKPLLFRRRVKNFDILKHPFFMGRMWYNRRGIELVKAGIITKELYAFLFFTSNDMVEWVIKHESEVIHIDEIDDEKIEEFINSCPHLKKPKIPENLVEV